jgi:putative transposase
MKYLFMATHEQEFSVKGMSKVLGVSRSGYYAWKEREPSRRTQANEAMLVDIRAVYEESRKTYGSPRIYIHLRRKGYMCGRNRVARLMQEHQIVAKRAHKRHPTTTQQHPGDRVAPNLLNREFTADMPNQKWVSDITYIDTAEGWLYLAVVMDLFSRRVVGWAMADHTQTSLVQEAFEMALLRRQPDQGLLHHSDQGSQYTSEAFQQILRSHHCAVSMSRVGNCYDNAPIESFFGTLKTECARQQFATRAQARTAIFEYIEIWYNRRRLHSALGYTSPAEFEQIPRH